MCIVCLRIVFKYLRLLENKEKYSTDLDITTHLRKLINSSRRPCRACCNANRVTSVLIFVENCHARATRARAALTHSCAKTQIVLNVIIIHISRSTTRTAIRKALSRKFPLAQRISPCSKVQTVERGREGGSLARSYRTSKRDILLWLLSRLFRGLPGEVVQSGGVESVPQESLRKILSLRFKAVTYCARIHLACRISLISRDALAKCDHSNERNTPVGSRRCG